MLQVPRPAPNDQSGRATVVCFSPRRGRGQCFAAYCGCLLRLPNQRRCWSQTIFASGNSYLSSSAACRVPAF